MPTLKIQKATIIKKIIVTVLYISINTSDPQTHYFSFSATFTGFNSSKDLDCSEKQKDNLTSQ